MKLNVINTSTATPWGSSRWAEMRRCGRAYELKYTHGVTIRKRSEDDDIDELLDDVNSADADSVEDLTPSRGTYFEVGSLVHAGQHWTLQGLLNREKTHWSDVINAAAAEGGDPEVIGEAARLLAAYYDTHGTENGGFPDEFELVGSEVPLMGAIGGLPVTTQADSIWRLRDSGDIIISDTKTRAKGLPKGPKLVEWKRNQSLNPQFLLTSWLVRVTYGLDYFPSIFVDTISKTKNPVAQRVWVPLDDDAVMMWHDAHEKMLQAHKLSLQIDPNGVMNHGACSTFLGTRCWLFGWCHGGEAVRRMHYEKKEDVVQ